MAVLEIDSMNGLYYEYDQPSRAAAPTFTFINPITGDCSLWQALIGPALREAGFGTLVYNFRGQANSPFSPDLALTDAIIVEDYKRLVNALSIEKPIAVGLSIGGLYAARASISGLDLAGLVLINTLRSMSPRIEWMNKLCVRLMQHGGASLLRDAVSHVVVGQATQAQMLNDIFDNAPEYTPIAEESGMFNLVTHMAETSWEIDYSRINAPVLVTTGYQDHVFYDPATVDKLFATIPNAQRLDMPQAGHMIPAERPKDLIIALLGFGLQIEMG